MRYAGVAFFAVLLMMEVAARIIGLGTTLVYEKTSYGYRVAPNQDVNRFGRNVYYNDLGLRNDSLAALPPENAIRILCVGDSITFGGTLTDQEHTYPHLLQKLLSSQPGTLKAEVLNASAGGWSTENEEGWLNTHGVLGAQWVVLQVASHDLFQRRSASEIVGKHPSFPERQPNFALQELVTRYALQLIGQRSHDPGVEIHDRSAADVIRVLSSIERIDMMVRHSRAKLIVLLIEQPKGIEPEDNLTLWAKEQLFARLSELGVPMIRPNLAIERAGGARLFRDGLHPNVEGNRVLARALFEFLSFRISRPMSHGSFSQPKPVAVRKMRALETAYG